MQIVGYRKTKFKTDEGVEKHGYYVFLINPELCNPDKGEGFSTDSFYCSDENFAIFNVKEHFKNEDDVTLAYNRFKKVIGIF